jgi:hypothetical protein
MNRIKNVGSFFIIASLLISGYSLPKVNALEKFTVALSSNRVKSFTTVQLSIPLNKSLKAGDWIKIDFPDTMELPDPSQSYYWRDNNDGSENNRRITLEEYLLRTTSIQFFSAKLIFEKVILNFKEKSILFLIPNLSTFIFQANEQLLFQFTCYNFVNPPESGSYYLSFSSSQEVKPKNSEIILIGPTKTSISDVKVSVSPTTFGRAANFEIRFKTSQFGAIKAESNINIQFPEGTIVPFYSYLIIDQILINGIQPESFYSSKNKNGIFDTLGFHSSIPIEASQEIVIQISSKLGIINPMQPGEKNLLIYTSTDTVPVESEKYTIVKGEPLLSSTPNITGLTTSFLLSFVLDKNQTLQKNQTIQVLMPESIEFGSKEIKEVDVRINQIPIEKNLLVLLSENHSIIIPFPVDIKAESLVQVRINGFKNPDKEKSIHMGYKIPGMEDWIFSEYTTISPSHETKSFTIKQFKMSSEKASTETSFYWEIGLEGVKSIASGESITINFQSPINFPQNFDSTKIIIRTLFSEGEMAKYTTHIIDQSVEIIFLENLYVSDLFISIDSSAKIKNPQTPFQWASILFSSSRKIYPEASKYYVKPVYTKIAIEYSRKTEKTGWFTQAPKFFIKTSNSLDYYYINNATFSSDITYQLPEGQYLLKIVTYEKAIYEYLKQEFTIKVDTVSPRLTLAEPNQETVLSVTSTYKINGKIDLPLTTWFDSPMQAIEQDLSINGNFVLFDPTKGTFEYPAVLIKGENVFLIVVEDWAGNIVKKEIHILFETGIQLKIGSKKVIAQGKTLALDAPPFIKSGRTFVPIRFIGELLNAKFQVITNAKRETTQVYIDFDGHQIEINLSNKTTKRDGKLITLEANPFINQGRLFVPLRFLSEQMNKRVVWNALDQTILIL